MTTHAKLRLVCAAVSFVMSIGPAYAVVIDPAHAVAYKFEVDGGPFDTVGGSISFAVADAEPFMELSLSVQSDLGATGAPGGTLTVPGWGVWTSSLPSGLEALRDGSFYVVASTSAGWVGVDLVNVTLRAIDGSLAWAEPISAVSLPVPEPSSLALVAGGLISVIAMARRRGRAAGVRAVGAAEPDCANATNPAG